MVAKRAGRGEVRKGIRLVPDPRGVMVAKRPRPLLQDPSLSEASAK
jgi:hypothetical protein